MIQLFYYKMAKPLQPEIFNPLLQRLPTVLQNKILKYRNWQDALRSLAGNILLIQAMQSPGREKYKLSDLKYTEFNKPYFDETINFNISHSGNYIICAVSEINKLGVDVEEIKAIATDDFNGLFAAAEWDEVINGQSKLQAFYTLWTKKEAFLKAVGCGLSQPLNEVVIVNNGIVWENKHWFLHEVKLDQHHIAYICCDVNNPTIHIQEIHL